MAFDADQISRDESELLESESRDARALDQQLAGDMRHRRLGGETSSAGYLRELGGRPGLPLAVERRLVEAAQTGDQRAREELVEAFLLLIAGVAPVPRRSRGDQRQERLDQLLPGTSIPRLRRLDQPPLNRERASQGDSRRLALDDPPTRPPPMAPYRRRAADRAHTWRGFRSSRLIWSAWRAVTVRLSPPVPDRIHQRPAQKRSTAPEGALVPRRPRLCSGQAVGRLPGPSLGPRGRVTLTALVVRA